MPEVRSDWKPLQARNQGGELPRHSYARQVRHHQRNRAAVSVPRLRGDVPANMRKGKKSFLPLLTATRNWRKEILEYFNHPISNGYTEALNGVAKVINRAGRGYTFEVLRAKGLSRNKRLQPAPEPVVQPTEPTRPKTLTRCDCCGGAYEPFELHRTRTGIRLEGEEHRGVSLYCGMCYERFHTAGGFNGSHDSTQLCE